MCHHYVFLDDKISRMLKLGMMAEAVGALPGMRGGMSDTSALCECS